MIGILLKNIEYIILKIQQKVVHLNIIATAILKTKISINSFINNNSLV